MDQRPNRSSLRASENTRTPRNDNKSRVPSYYHELKSSREATLRTFGHELESGILNRFSALRKGRNVCVGPLFKPILGLVPLPPNVRDYETRHPNASVQI